ncbi:thiaminase II [Clostridium frigidicarnis]|uniref:Aminopyrimidine aminohydrolase n=1 Tax=Clostridium frigidicarnis TaxID=84698 RepID=A0A1I0W439_9CLOT|nr:thiaminase II [Clostridium frigidicarnis]SFA83515.1 thiaminase /4-amino-5-aminomethyl-2-methylpyrimidine deaminase [Clostridium frigidicarnis]
MKFTEYLFEESKEIWEGYLNHPFIKELANGTLPKEKFKNYLIQDYLYLKEYSKVFCLGVIKASTMEEMRFFYNAIKGSMDDETAVHITYLKNFGIKPTDLERCESTLITKSYTSYMKGEALTGELKEIAAAVLPCTWSYNYIGMEIAKRYKDNLKGNFYEPWVEVYSSQSYKDFTDEWIEYTDNLCSNLTEKEKEKLRDIFVTSSIYEMQFWDMAYEEVK